MKKTLLCITLAYLLILLTPCSYAQSVGVSGIGSVPDVSALLDVGATGMSPQKGILIPRVALTSSTDAATVTTPATSLMVYNTTAAGTTPTNVPAGRDLQSRSNSLRICNPGSLKIASHFQRIINPLLFGQDCKS